jgi:hypothetical protein
VLGLPILALNLLSTREAQFEYDHHYSLLLIPGLMAAAVYGAGNLAAWWARRHEAGQDAGTLRPVQIGSLILVLWGLVMQLPYRNPAISAFRYPEPAARVKAANELVAQVPSDARVAVSSKLAPHLLPRRYIYNFPPAPYSPYNFGPRTRDDYVDLDFVMVDPNASALDLAANSLGGKSGLELLQTLPEWQLLAEKDGLFLYQRR